MFTAFKPLVFRIASRDCGVLIHFVRRSAGTGQVTLSEGAAGGRTVNLLRVKHYGTHTGKTISRMQRLRVR